MNMIDPDGNNYVSAIKFTIPLRCCKADFQSDVTIAFHQTSMYYRYYMYTSMTDQ